jgi:plasmid stabilization system protein ParE
VNAVVVLSPLAEDDLVEIWCTVAADDIRAADKLVDELHQVTMSPRPRWPLALALLTT